MCGSSIRRRVISVAISRPRSAYLTERNEKSGAIGPKRPLSIHGKNMGFEE